MEPTNNTSSGQEEEEEGNKQTQWRNNCQSRMIIETRVAFPRSFSRAK
jgi:hypothetical protein